MTRFVVSGVVVPDALAGAVRRLMLAGMHGLGQRDDVSLSPDARELLEALRVAAVRWRDASTPHPISDVGRNPALDLSGRDAVTVTEAATRLGVTPRRVRQWIDDGRLAAVRSSSGWLCDADGVAALERERSV